LSTKKNRHKITTQEEHPLPFYLSHQYHYCRLRFFVAVTIKEAEPQNVTVRNCCSSIL